MGEAVSGEAPQERRRSSLETEKYLFSDDFLIILFFCRKFRREYSFQSVVPVPMWYVYILQSLSNQGQEYIGVSQDLRRRLADHNQGKSAHTSKYAPWRVVWYCAFPEKMKALDFERYLKSHSGRAFAKKRLTPPA